MNTGQHLSSKMARFSFKNQKKKKKKRKKKKNVSQVKGTILVTIDVPLSSSCTVNSVKSNLICKL